jgi:hypothetical protein
MVTRRDLLRAGAAISVLPLAAHAATEPGAPTPAFHTVLFDARFPEARQFGAEATRLRMNVRSFHGDLTNVWFHELAPVWRAQPVATADMALAGMTDYGALFVLERLAWDAGMRVVYRAEHRLGTASRPMIAIRQARGSTVKPLGPHCAPDTLLSWIIAPKSQVGA